MDEIQKMSDDIDFDNWTHFFTSPNLVPIDFIGFRGPMNI